MSRSSKRQSPRPNIGTEQTSAIMNEFANYLSQNLDA